jgi:Protein of unknown function (DUF2589)
MTPAPTPPQEESYRGPASEIAISLAEALLAPLDAILKAQTHAARSFLNLVLQLGYPHQPVDSDGMPMATPIPGGAAGTPSAGPSRMYELTFDHEVTLDGVTRRQRVSVPALALVPISPLAVQSAEIHFEMAVKEIHRNPQLQTSKSDGVGQETSPKAEAFDRFRRPWFLVDQPVSIYGTLAPPTTAGIVRQRTAEATIQIAMKLASIPMPAGLDKLLTTLTELRHINEV